MRTRSCGPSTSHSSKSSVPMIAITDHASVHSMRQTPSTCSPTPTLIWARTLHFRISISRTRAAICRDTKIHRVSPAFCRWMISCTKVVASTPLCKGMMRSRAFWQESSTSPFWVVSIQAITRKSRRIQIYSRTRWTLQWCSKDFIRELKVMLPNRTYPNSCWWTTRTSRIIRTFYKISPTYNPTNSWQRTNKWVKLESITRLWNRMIIAFCINSRITQLIYPKASLTLREWKM